MATMTRQHFQLIADVLRKTQEDNTPSGMTNELCSQIASTFANELAKTNPGFKRDRFLKACGVES